MVENGNKTEKLYFSLKYAQENPEEVYLALAKHFGIPDDDPRVIEAKQELVRRNHDRSLPDMHAKD